MKKVKKIVKKKKKRRKKKPVVDQQEEQEGEPPQNTGVVSQLAENSLVAMLQERILDTGQSESPDYEEEEEESKTKDVEKRSVRNQVLDDYPEGPPWRRSGETAEYENEEEVLASAEEQEEIERLERELEREDGVISKGSRVIVDTREFGGVFVGTGEGQQKEEEEQRDEGVGDEGPAGRVVTSTRSRRASASRPQSTLAARESRPATRAAMEAADLPALDNNKLAHVQRRRIASNQGTPAVWGGSKFGV